jgi:hypothetical protein
MKKRGRINKKKNKKAVQLTLETVLLLILTVVAVVILLGFFNQSSQHLFGRIKSYFIHSNVDAVVESCNILSSSGSDYAFCCDKKEVKYSKDGKKAEGLFTCFELINEKFINNKINKINCEEISCG